MSLSCRWIILLALLLPALSQAATIFSDDFQDGNFTGWTIGGTGSRATANLYAGNYSLRLR